MKCNLCPRRCNAERTENTNIGGYCKMPLPARLARAALHFWEEPCISGKNGSGTVFFSGCSLNCVFCQNFDVSHKGYGEIVSSERLAEIFRELEDLGAHNINLVTPTHFVPAIIKALDIYRPQIPVVYNSGGYDETETLNMLENYIDIYLMDMKYISGDRAQRYSAAANYPEYAQKAIKEACRQQPQCIFKDGIMQKGVIIRHLLLPQGTREAEKVFDWARENAPGAYFSIMSQYMPCGCSGKTPEINRRVTAREYNKVLDYIFDSGFENVYIQERSSADNKFVPDFDLTGINPCKDKS